MTFTRSRRSLAVTALAASLVLPVAASAAGPGPTGHHTPTPGGYRHPSSSRYSSRHKVSGILTWLNYTTVPATLVLSGTTTVTVTVPATTTVVRGYGGHSSLDEFAVGDRIIAQGSFQKGSTTIFKARWVKDWSLRARSRVVGSVASVLDLPNSFTLQVARRGSQYNSYQGSQPVTVTLTSKTLIVSGSVTMTVDALHQGVRVLAMGVYNRTQHTMRASRVRILSAHARRRHA